VNADYKSQNNIKYIEIIPLNVLPAVRYCFYLLRPSRDFRILYVPHAGLRQHKSPIFQSKTLTVKNKNKIFPKFLSPSITTSYGHKALKNARFFGSKLHTRLIIEAQFLEFTLDWCSLATLSGALS
jgi:hypothetical protein